MDERITLRIPKDLNRSLQGYCNTTGKGKSEALREVLQRGFQKLRARDRYSEGREDLSRLFRPVIRSFEEQARRLLGVTAKEITDELHIAMAGLRDDFTALAVGQKELFERLDEVEAAIEAKAAIEPTLVTVICEIRGITHALLSDTTNASKAKENAIRCSKDAGKRLGVEVFPNSQAHM